MSLPTHKRPTTRLAWWCLLAVAALVPPAMSNVSWLRILPGVGAPSSLTADQFDIVKLAVVTVLVLTAATAWTWTALGRGATVRTHRVVLVLLALALGWIALSTALSVHVPTALLGKYRRYEGLFTFALYALVFFLALQEIHTAERRRSLARVFCASSAIVGGYAVLQYAGLDPALWGTTSFGADRAFSTFGNPNLLGGFLVLALPVAVGLTLGEQGTRRRIGSWTMVLLIGAGWLTAFTRGAWIAGAVALAVVAVVALRRRVRPQPLDWGLATIGAAAAVGVVIRSLGSADPVTNAWERMRSIFVFDQGSGRSRTLIWQAAVDAIRDRPLVGSGPDTFRLIFPSYKPAAYVQEVGYLSVADNAHNYLLQLATTIGVPGALLLAGVVAWVLVSAAPWRNEPADQAVAVRSARRDPRSSGRVGAAAGTGGVRGTGRARGTGGARGTAPGVAGDTLLLVGFWAGALGYVVHLTFGLSVVGSSVFLWMFLGVLLAPVARSKTLGPIRGGRIVGGAAIGAALAAVAWTGVSLAADHAYAMNRYADTGAQKIAALERAVSLNPYNGEYRSELGYARMRVLADVLAQLDRQRESGGDAQAAEAAARAELALTVAAVEEAMRRSPLEYDNYVALAMTYNWGGGLEPAYREKAVAVAEKGVALSPVSPSIRVQLGTALLALGRYPEAEAQAREAARLDPRYGDPLVLLGDIHRAAGRRDEAAEAYRAALALDPADVGAAQGLQSVTETTG